LFLTDKLFQSARAHAVGERSGRGRADR